MNATTAEDYAMVHRMLHPKPGEFHSDLDVITDPTAIIEAGRDLIHGRRTGFISVYIKPGGLFNGYAHTAHHIIEPVTVMGMCTVPDKVEDSTISLAWAGSRDIQQSCGLVKLGDIDKIHVQRQR